MEQFTLKPIVTEFVCPLLPVCADVAIFRLERFRNLHPRNGAQLLFTSHDMYTLKNTVFRRDEIWFAAENDAHESEIYSLHEIRGEDNDRIKSTAAYDKQYLEGRYGADPYLSNMLGGGF